MDERTLIERLCRVIGAVVGASRVPADVGIDTPLGDRGLWMDSVETLQVLLASEAEFGITFEPAEDLAGDGVLTVGALAAIIRRRSSSLAPADPAASPPL